MLKLIASLLPKAYTTFVPPSICLANPTRPHSEPIIGPSVPVYPLMPSIPAHHSCVAHEMSRCVLVEEYHKREDWEKGYLAGISKRRPSDFATSRIFASPTTAKLDYIYSTVFHNIPPAFISSRAKSSSQKLITGNRQQSMDKKMTPDDHMSMAVVW